MNYTTTDYTNFDAAAYVEDASFRAWVWQHSEGATLFWERFIREHPHKLPEISQAKAVVLGMSIAQEPMDIAEIESRIQITLGKIRPVPVVAAASKQAGLAPVRRLWPVHRIALAAAASVVLLLGAGLVWLVNGNASGTLRSRLTVAGVPAALAEQVNNTLKPMTVLLSDSSVVVLQPNSKLWYAKKFGGASRQVYLTGEARFDVTHHPNRPFFVYAQNVVTKVLGTSFTVRAFANEQQVQVQVKTGRVSVYTNPESLTTGRAGRKGILLTPNQQVSYSKDRNELTRTLVNQPALLPVSVSSTGFVYDETPVADVLAALERAYSIPIVFDEANLSHCLLTATLTKQPFYAKLDLICQAIGGQYEVVDGTVIISSSGCR
jgi:transmembrane sensor